MEFAQCTQVSGSPGVFNCMRALPGALAALLVTAATASAHTGAPAPPDSLYKWGEQNSPTFSAAMKNVPNPQFEEGDCTAEAARSMPASKDHDHLDPSQ